MIIEDIEPPRPSDSFARLLYLQCSVATIDIHTSRSKHQVLRQGMAKGFHPFSTLVSPFLIHPLASSVSRHSRTNKLPHLTQRLFAVFLSWTYLGVVPSLFYLPSLTLQMSLTILLGLTTRGIGTTPMARAQRWLWRSARQEETPTSP